MEPLRLLLIADDALARLGLALLLANRPEVSVIGQTDSGWLAEDPADQDERPDVALWDMGSGDLSTPLPDLTSLTTAVPLVVLAANEAQAGAAWVAGARALLRRELEPERLVAALQAALHGFILLEPELSGGMVTAVAPATPTETLTPRELDVLHLLAEGLTNKAIAQRLSISEHTVKFHINALMGKLNAQSRTEAVVLATRHGLISL